MNLALASVGSSRTYAWIALIVGLGVLYLGGRAWIRHSGWELERCYRVRRCLKGSLLACALAASVVIWSDVIVDVVDILALLGTGLIIALSDPIRNLFAGTTSLARRQVRLGERVEIAGASGDVVAIGVWGFDVLEIGNWVDADQSTGRLVHIPFNRVLTEPMAVYDREFPWLWHEVSVHLSFQSDWERARELLADSLQRESDRLALPDDGLVREPTGRYLIRRYTATQPAVYVSIGSAGIRLTGRIRCPVRERRRVESGVTERFLRLIDEEQSVRLIGSHVHLTIPDSTQLPVGHAAVP